MGTQKNRFTETIILSTHNIGLEGQIKIHTMNRSLKGPRNVFELSTSSSDKPLCAHKVLKCVWWKPSQWCCYTVLQRQISTRNVFDLKYLSWIITCSSCPEQNVFVSSISFCVCFCNLLQMSDRLSDFKKAFDKRGRSAHVSTQCMVSVIRTLDIYSCYAFTLYYNVRDFKQQQ